MSPVPVSADRRFHRARVKPSRKRGRIRALSLSTAKYGIPLLLTLWVGYRGISAVNGSPRFQIANVSVEGNTRTTTAEVMAVLDGLIGRSLVSTDLDEWREKLQSTPWIREATFRRSLPSLVKVVVSEREPIGIGRLKGRLYLIDERGAVIDEFGPQYSTFDLPIIDGLASTSGAGGLADAPRAELVSRLIASLRVKPAIAARLSQIDVSDVHNAAVIVNGDPALIYVGEDRFLIRLESYLGLAAALRERVPDIDYVDLRFEDRIYVRPSKGVRNKRVVALASPDPEARAMPANAKQR